MLPVSLEYIILDCLEFIYFTIGVCLVLRNCPLNMIKLIYVLNLAYPQAVSTTLTSNTTIDTSIDVNVTLDCLHSQSSPRVTLQYEVS